MMGQGEVIVGDEQHLTAVQLGECKAKKTSFLFSDISVSRGSVLTVASPSDTTVSQGSHLASLAVHTAASTRQWSYVLPPPPL